MSLLGGTFRVYAQPQAFARLLAGRAEFLQLMDGVKDDVVGVLQKRFKFVLPVGSAEDMDLTLGHLLFAQPGLIETAGLGARQILGQEGVEVIVGKGLLGQQHLAAGTLRQGGQYLAVCPQPRLVNHIGGGGKPIKQGLEIVVCKARKLGIV